MTHEINDIAKTQTLTVLNLLDGTNSSINFQLGVDATDQLNVALESSKATDLGLMQVWELIFSQVLELNLLM